MLLAGMGSANIQFEYYHFRATKTIIISSK